MREVAPARMILVSACLAGLPTRYDGYVMPPHPAAAARDPAHVLVLCPKALGGLPTPPHLLSRFVGARLGHEGEDFLAGRTRMVDISGRDLSAAFIAGVRKVFARARAAGVSEAWLKDRSPSCAHDPGGANPLDGPRQGVLTALLLFHGITVAEMCQAHQPSRWRVDSPPAQG